MPFCIYFCCYGWKLFSYNIYEKENIFFICGFRFWKFLLSNYNNFRCSNIENCYNGLEDNNDRRYACLVSRWTWGILFFDISDDLKPVFTTSRYGKPAIQMGKYRFNKWSGSKGPRARWICVKACYGCKATIITVYDEITNYCHEHNHWHVFYILKKIKREITISL